jgi:branched-subunit amino acid aminotransferase/4-amino-4-deoxychorismate lyase
MAGVIRPDAGAGIFETVLVIDGRPIALEPHLRRLASSAGALYGAKLGISQGSALESAVRRSVAGLTGPHRLRILAAHAGGGQVNVELETQPASSAFDGRLGPAVALVPTVIEGGLGPHKWRDRAILERRRAELGLETSSHLLITDTDGAVLETERANVVALVAGGLVSPPPDGRLLAGVTVTFAFAAAARLGVPAEFAPLTLADLKRAGEVFCTSAVSGLTPAGLAGRPPAGDAGPSTGQSRGAGAPGDDEGIAARLGPALFESWRS